MPKPGRLGAIASKSAYDIASDQNRGDGTGQARRNEVDAGEDVAERGQNETNQRGDEENCADGHMCLLLAFIVRDARGDE